MATRREVAQRKANLIAKLRQAILTNQLAPGSLIPPLRELAEQNGISVQVIRQGLQELLDEGILYTVPYVGTFVGKPPTSATEIYALLLNQLPEVIGGHYLQLRVGFEEQIAQLGGTSLVLTRDRASYCREHGQLPPLAGIFAFSEFLNQELLIWGKEDRIPLVNFDGCVEDPIHADRVSFDDTDGGRQATQHLISLGYRQIAFVALHRSDDIASLPWSTEREAGWREALAEIGQPTDGLIFHPETLISHTYDRNTTVLEYARQLANTLLLRTDITAVITANDDLALYLIEMFKEIGLPTTQWPALIGFDNSPRAASEFQLSSLRLPWEDLGREAAMLLWQRSHGKVNGAPQHHRVHMSLIARFTSHRNWSLLSHSTTSPRS